MFEKLAFRLLFPVISMTFFIVLSALLVVTETRLLSSAQLTEAGPQGWGGHSARAVDGDRSSQWKKASCTHSKAPKGTGNWWRVMLGKPFRIEYVRIYNRLDCCSNRINGAKVYAGGKLCGTVKYSGKPFQEVSCSEKTAEQVTIRQPLNYLTLCEVEVYGYSAEEEKEEESFKSKATKAVIGNASGKWKIHKSCTPAVFLTQGVTGKCRLVSMEKGKMNIKRNRTG